MSMHIMPAFVTTTSTRKRKSSNNKRAALQRAEHEAWVLSMTGGKKADKKVLDKMSKSEYTKSMMVDRSAFQKSGMAPGAFSKPDQKVYSGERRLLGIATMHKSNMVPVFDKQNAEDIARMRRG